MRTDLSVFEILQTVAEDCITRLLTVNGFERETEGCNPVRGEGYLDGGRQFCVRIVHVHLAASGLTNFVCGIQLEFLQNKDLLHSGKSGIGKSTIKLLFPLFNNPLTLSSFSDPFD